jgi:nicotinamidase-related amidase
VPLVDPDDSILAIVDAQPGFIDDAVMSDEARARAGAAVERIAWLAGFAEMIGVPVVVVEETPGKNGATDARIAERLPAGTPIETKPSFGLTGCAEIVEAIGRTGRRTVVLTGFETDVCVAQSAIGLHDLGYRVVVLEDAAYTTSESEHRHGLTRMTHAGIEPNHFKGVIFEWLETIERAEQYYGAAVEKLGKPRLRG